MTPTARILMFASLTTLATAIQAQDVIMRRAIKMTASTSAASGGATTPAATPTPAQSADGGTSTTPAPLGDWIPCAAENGYCTTSNDARVRYGDGTTYAYQTVKLGVACTNAVFGDPTPNVVKHCDYQVAAATPTPTPTATSSPSSLPVPQSSADVASNVRAFAQDVYDAAAHTLKVPTALADLPGLPAPQFGSGATLLGDSDTFQAQGGNSYVFRLQVNDPVACGIIDGAVGGSSTPGGSGSIDQTRPEGCGGYYSQTIYWKRIDGAQAGGQAAYLRSVARSAVTQAAATIASQVPPIMPATYADAGFPQPDVANISDDRGHPYDTGLYSNNILHVMRVHYRSICSAINVATGGQDNVDGGVPSDFSRPEGCSGYYGDMYYWLRGDGEIGNALANHVRGMRNAVTAAAGRATANPTDYAAIGMTEPALGNEVADTGFVQQNDENVWFADVAQRAVCDNLAQGAGMAGTADSVNYDIPEGCGGYYGRLRYWKHIQGAALPNEIALIETYMHKVRAAALKATKPWSSIADLGIATPDLGNVADLGAGSNGFANIEGNDVYVINLHSQALCSALSAANGGPSSVNGGYDSGWNRAEGCSGYYGNVWYYIQMPPKPAALAVEPG